MLDSSLHAISRKKRKKERKKNKDKLKINFTYLYIYIYIHLSVCCIRVITNVGFLAACNFSKRKSYAT